MATYYATNASGLTLDKAQAIQEPDGYDITVPFSILNSAYATEGVLVTADVVQLAKIPKGAVIIDWYLYAADIDGGSSLTLDLGLLYTDENAFLNASTIGQAGGLASPYIAATNGLIANAIPYAEVNVAVATSADGSDIFALTVAAGSTGAGATGASAITKGWVRYIWRPTVF